MARAIESFDFSAYDIVISSSSGFAHGCITRPETLYIVYYHSPARYMWDWTHEYRKEIGWNRGVKNMIFNKLLYRLRQWDYQAGQRHDVALAASQQIANRIQKYYRRDSTIVYPPVETGIFSIGSTPLYERDTYIIASALTEFKRVDLAVRAFNELGYPLIIAGDGAQKSYLESIAKDNISFVGRKSREQLNDLYSQARGFILAGREDFGIAPLEAMAAGIPVF